MKLYLSLLFTVLCSVPLFAQTASLHGVVTDESGGVVPGATVTVSGSAGPARTSRTNSEGIYLVTGFHPGDYTVQALAPGLAMPQPLLITLKAGAQSLNLELKVAARTEQVTVGDGGDSIRVRREDSSIDFNHRCNIENALACAHAQPFSQTSAG